MKHISELKDYGKGKTALLIGGGPSAANIPDMGDIRINANYPYHGKPVDFMCYYDETLRGQTKDLDYTFKVIGFRRSVPKPQITFTPKCDYWAQIHEDVKFVDSGHHCLQIATRWMNFDKIYLIGYDYTHQEGEVHYYKPDDDFDYMARYEAYLFTKALRKWKYPNCNHKIMRHCRCKPSEMFKKWDVVNLSQISKLDLFPVKVAA